MFLSFPVNMGTIIDNVRRQPIQADRINSDGEISPFIREYRTTR